MKNIPFIPISGWFGENLTEKSPNTPWYKGPTLLEAMNLIEIPRRATDKPLRIAIEKVYHENTTVVGKVLTGVIKEGDNLAIAPGNIRVVAKSL